MLRNQLFKVLAYSAAAFAAFLLTASGVVYAVSRHTLNRRLHVPVAAIAIPSDPVAIERGRHIVATRACSDCHGSDFGGAKVIDDPLAGVFNGPNLSGGKIPGAPPDWPAASNLTPHGSSRVARWTEEQFIQTVRTRQRPDGTKLSAVMPTAYANMTDLELKALWAYLRSVPARETGMH